MRKIVSLILIVIIVLSCKNIEKKNTLPVSNTPVVTIDTMLITDSSWGFINSQLNFSDLQVIYGENNIKDERICGPECIDSIDVTILYPGTKNEAIIYWKDSSYHKTIGVIRCFSDSASYHTSTGIKIGSGLTDLLKLNRQKITFYGFGWDYGGGIISFNKGTLEKSPVHFELDAISEVDNSLLGDTELHTEMPLVKKYLDKIRVRLISLSFYKQDEY